MPRIVIPIRYVCRAPLLVLELDNGRARVEHLRQRDSISLAKDSILAVCARREVEPPIGLMMGETTLGIESLAALSASASEPSLSGEPCDRERIRRPSS